MKKLFKVLSVIAIIIVILVGLVIGGAFAIEGIKTLKMRNDRINNSNTLSKYVEYHGWEYIGGTLNALEFYAEDIKCDLLKDRNVLYFNDNYMGEILILDDYTIYETAFTSDKTYSNGQQYKLIGTDLKIKRIQVQTDTLYLISEDDKYYTFSYGEIKEINERENGTTYPFLKNKNIKKIVQIYKESNNGTNKQTYIVLKADGQIYEQEYKRNYNSKQSKWEYTLLEEKVVFSKKDYGHITDFTYATGGDYIGIVKVVSDKGLYWLKQTNEQQYIDTEPTYELVLSDIYNKYKKDIKFISSEYVFTTDNNIIRTDMLSRDIDKEVK